MGGYSRTKLEAELTRDEDLRLRVYRCTAKKLTIGIGRNLEARRRCSDGSTAIGITPAETKALGVTVASATRDGITRDQALGLFANDIAGCEKDLDRSLPWWRTLSDVRQRVLLNMCFNMGIVVLLGFKNTLQMMQSGRYADAAKGMLASKWAGQVGARADRLAAMMRAG